MGMFDNLRCEYPLPVDGANELLFQTKDTPVQFLDLYKIDVDGQLWHENYEVEDQSDPNAEGFARLAGCCTRVNQRWEKENFLGVITFYSMLDEEDESSWVEFSAEFIDGKLRKMTHSVSPLPSNEEQE